MCEYTLLPEIYVALSCEGRYPIAQAMSRTIFSDCTRYRHFMNCDLGMYTVYIEPHDERCEMRDDNLQLLVDIRRLFSRVASQRSTMGSSFWRAGQHTVETTSESWREYSFRLQPNYVILRQCVG